MMDDDQSIIYGLDSQARCLTSVQCGSDVDDDRPPQFIVGTQGLKADNHVSVLTVVDDSITRQSYVHAAGEVTHLAAHPHDERVLATCHTLLSGAVQTAGCSVWRLPADEAPETTSRQSALQLQSSYAAAVKTTKACEWQPSNGPSAKLLVAHDRTRVSLCDVSTEHMTSVHTIDTSAMKTATADDNARSSTLRAGSAQVHTLCWDPHHGSNVFAVAVDNHVRGVDVRQNGSVCAWSLAATNDTSLAVRALDYNPNRAHMVVSGGDDGRVNVWDVRQATVPLSSVRAHNHWIWSTRYNSTHDQLLLTCSSDATLVLHNMTTLSSDDDDTAMPADVPRDGVIARYVHHEDSVYACAWSTHDPWMFASLSYDGRLVIQHVPKAVKYGILQL